MPPRGSARARPFPSQRLVACLSRADAHRPFHWKDENLAVADLAGARRCPDRLDRRIDLIVADRNLEAHFRHEGDVVFGAAIDLGVPLLPAIAIGLADGHSLDAQPIERRSHLVQFERLDDRQDELHDRTPSKDTSLGAFAMLAKSPTQARIYT